MQVGEKLLLRSRSLRQYRLRDRLNLAMTLSCPLPQTTHRLDLADWSRCRHPQSGLWIRIVGHHRHRRNRREQDRFLLLSSGSVPHQKDHGLPPVSNFQSLFVWTHWAPCHQEEAKRRVLVLEEESHLPSRAYCHQEEVSRQDKEIVLCLKSLLAVRILMGLLLLICWPIRIGILALWSRKTHQGRLDLSDIVTLRIHYQQNPPRKAWTLACFRYKIPLPAPLLLRAPYIKGLGLAPNLKPPEDTPQQEQFRSKFLQERPRNSAQV